MAIKRNLTTEETGKVLGGAKKAKGGLKPVCFHCSKCGWDWKQNVISEREADDVSKCPNVLDVTEDGNTVLCDAQENEIYWDYQQNILEFLNSPY